MLPKPPIQPVEELPKILRRYADRIAGVSDERGLGEGCWVALKDGWEDLSNQQCHTIHEDTFAKCLPFVRDATFTCRCSADCKAANSGRSE